MEQRNESISFSPYRFGKSTHAWTEFLTRGKAGESIALAYPEGNFLSPKAAENALKAKEIEVLQRIMEFVDDQRDVYPDVSHIHPKLALDSILVCINSKLAALKGEKV